MIFKPESIEVMRWGGKTQTRRVYKIGETARDINGELVINELGERVSWRPIHAVYHPSGRIKWQREWDYAVQPGRGKIGEARLFITRIRFEPLRDIKEMEIWAEGYIGAPVSCPHAWFIQMWDSINTRRGTRWSDKPLVWALTFEVAEEYGD